MNRERVYDGFYKVDLVETPVGTREVVVATDSVNALFYFPDQGKVLLVRQPRVAMISSDSPDGLITETVAGRFDVDLGVIPLIIEEAEEEVGAHITAEDIDLLNNGKPMALSAGCITERAYLACITITSDQIDDEERTFGCAAEGEKIQRVWMTLEEFETYECEDLRVFAFREWLRNRIRQGAEA